MYNSRLLLHPVIPWINLASSESLQRTWLVFTDGSCYQFAHQESSLWCLVGIYGEQIYLHITLILRGPFTALSPLIPFCHQTFNLFLSKLLMSWPSHEWGRPMPQVISSLPCPQPDILPEKMTSGDISYHCSLSRSPCEFVCNNNIFPESAHCVNPYL